MIYELPTIQILPRLKVRIRIVSGTLFNYEFDLIPAIYGLDWM